MKKYLAILLAALLAFSAFGAIAEGDYSEHVSFTGSGLAELSDDGDYTSDAVYQYMTDKFNFDYELYALTWANWSEKNRIWISTNDMPDFTFWDINYSEYLDYIDQGLIRALPDGWEERFPNLKSAVDATGIGEKIKVDGKTYMIPKVTFFAFIDFDASVSTQGLFYRKDWLEQLGMEPFGTSVTMDQVIAFAKAAIEADLAGTGNTIGITSDTVKLTNEIMNLNSVGYDQFVKKDGKYVWGPTMDSVVDSIEYYRELYQSGIFDPDFYLYNSKEHRNVFTAGNAAMMLCEGSVDNVVSRINEFGAANEGDPYDKIGFTTILGSDGKWHGMASGNFWAASIFNPELDDVTMERILAIFDFLCTKEGQELVSLGIKDKDWTVDESGNYVLLREKDADGNYPHIKTVYPSICFWFTLVVLPDAFAFDNPGNDMRARQTVLDMYDTKLSGQGYIPFDADYKFYTSDAKATYSVDVNSEIVRLVLDGDANIAEEWAKFIEKNSGMWKPLLDELNENFAE